MLGYREASSLLIEATVSYGLVPRGPSAELFNSERTRKSLLPGASDATADAMSASTCERAVDSDGRQLFTLLSRGSDPADLGRIRDFRPGGITRHAGPDAAAERAIFADLNGAAPVPLLISADLEGSRMSLAAGVEMPNPLALAAIDDVEVTAEISRIMAEEARAIGINWSFTPVLDIKPWFADCDLPPDP